MKNLFGIATTAGVLALTGIATAQFVNVQDFEAGTAGGNLPTTWYPATSGTSTNNINSATDAAVYSDEQVNGGTLSGKLTWTWLDPATNGSRVRIQPGATGFISANNQAVDRTSTPHVGFYLYGNNQGDRVALYMGQGNDGGSQYEAFSNTDINWTGWKLYERHLLNDPVTGFLVGDGILPATNSISGLVFYKPTANPTSTATVTYYVDDFGYSSTPRNASVGNWSVY